MAEGLVIKNKLRIVRKVGRGGMGHVYEVYHEVLRVRRALKQIVSDLQDNPEIERRFLHEAQMMARLEHPHIVKVFDVDQEPGFGTYLLMEFIQGRDLGSLLRERGRFSYEETIRIGMAVASALDCAHGAGLVHRDIKPANILVEEATGRPVVTDFGIAKEVEGAGDEAFTKTGSFVGTYRYSSREQIRAEKGVPIDGRADVYSLGVVLYEISTGHRYLEGMPELKIASCVGYQDDWRPPLSFPDDLPEDFRALIEKALEPDRNRRVENAQALMRGLEECLGRGAGPTWATPSASVPPRDSPPLAATATGSTGSSGAVQEIADAATALDDSDTGVTERRARERARLVVRLQDLRKAVDGQSVDFERLLKTLQGFDLPRDEFRQLDDMSQILHRVEQAEQEGELDAAIASLEGLSDRLQRNSSRMESSLVAAVERSSDELRRRWRRLVEVGAAWVEDDRSERVERSLAALAGALAAHRWDDCRTALEQASREVTVGWRDARERAARHVEAGLAGVAERLAALDESSPAEARRSGIEPAKLAGELSGLLEQGELGRAAASVDTALATLDGILAEVARRGAEEAAAARTRCEQAFAAIPRAAAGRIAAADLARAEARRDAAEEAARAGDHRGARGAFSEAAGLAVALAEQVGRALAAERAEAEAALRELLDQSRDAPDEVVGAARSAAAAAIAARDVPDEAATARLELVRDALARALAEAERFATAAAAEELALAALARARSASPTPDELAPGERAIAAARTAAAERDWDTAAERWATAASTLDALVRDLAERRERDHLEATRQRAEALLAALPRERAAALAAADLEAGERHIAAARSAVDAGDRAAASEGFAEAAGLLERVRDQVAAELVESAARVAKRFAEVRPSFGDLLAEDELEEPGKPLAAARRATADLRLIEAEGELMRAEAAFVALRERAASRARDRIGAALAALEEAAARLATASPASALAPDDRPEAVRDRADELLANGQSAAGVALVEGAAQAARDSAAAVIARLEGESAGLRSRLAELRGALAGRRVAPEEVAAEELRRAADGESEARELDDRGALEAALAARREAEAVLVRALASVGAAERALLDDEAERLRGALDAAGDGAEEILGPARAAAARALDAAAAADGPAVASALDALSAAAEQVAAAAAEARQYGAATEARAAAEAGRARAAAGKPPRRRLRAAERLERDGAKAFQKRRWGEAQQAYRGAAEAFAAIAAEIEAKAAAAAEAADATQVATAPRAVPKAAVFGGAALALVLAIGGWLVWDRVPTSAPEPEVRERRAEDAVREPRMARVEEPAAKSAAKEVPVAPPAERPAADADADAAKRDADATERPAAGVDAAPADAPGTDVARVAPPAPPEPPARPRIASFSPEAAAVTVPEGGRETFRIALADVPAGERPAIEWRLGDEVVARDAPEFVLTPDFTAAERADGAPVELVARVGGADGPAQRWEVDVTDVNRAPALEGTTPPTDKAIEAEAGTKVALAARVSDPDEDRLRYTWKVDGKPLPGDGPRIEVPVQGDARVEMTASDGEDDVSAEWRIAAIRPPFRLETRPASLDRLAYAAVQEFRADLPRGLDADGVELEWSVDGRRVASGRTFRFANDDPARIRKTPVKVALRATDGAGRTFSRDWSFLVAPPAPKIAAAEPAPGRVALDRGGEQVFSLEAAAPVGDQALEYVFEVDGRRVQTSGPRLAYDQRDDRPHTVVAYVRDNFDQASAKQRWTIQPRPPAADIVARAREWLSQYEDAFNRKDAQRIGQLRGLSPDGIAKLQDALDDQQGLRVTFSNVRVEKIDDDRARIRYERTDRFTEARDGRPVERSGSFEQVVGMSGGQLRELETRRR